MAKLLLAVGILIAVILVAMLDAQYPIHDTPNASYLRPPRYIDNGFAFCTLAFTRDRTEAAGSGWSTDYPGAGHNFMLRLPEITTLRVNEQGGEPRQWVVPASSDALFGCPFLLISDGGTMNLSPSEAARLRRYLEKGGFLWWDDSWGSEAWSQVLREIAKIAPDWTIHTPSPDHHIFGLYTRIEAVRQVANVGFWSVGGQTSERGDDSPETPLRVLLDDRDQVVAVITHNTDIADTWEQEGLPNFFDEFALDGYGLGANVLIYTMTH